MCDSLLSSVITHAKVLPTVAQWQIKLSLLSEDASAWELAAQKFELKRGERQQDIYKINTALNKKRTAERPAEL